MDGGDGLEEKAGVDIERQRRSSGTARKAEPRRLARPAPAAELLARVLDPATRRQGFADVRVVTEWAAIVGEEWASQTAPLQLDRRTRTLAIRVEPTAALLVQHDEPKLLERINTFFGTTVAVRLRLRQGPVARPAQQAPRPPLAAEEIAAVDATVAAVSYAGLRDALRDLGCAIRRNHKLSD